MESLQSQFITAGQFFTIMAAMIAVIWATVRFSIYQIVKRLDGRIDMVDEKADRAHSRFDAHLHHHD